MGLNAGGIEIPLDNFITDDLKTLLGDCEVIHVPGYAAQTEVPLVDSSSLTYRLEIASKDGLISTVYVMNSSTIRVKEWFSRQTNGHLKGFRVGEKLILCSGNYADYPVFLITSGEVMTVQTGTSITDYGIVVIENKGKITVGICSNTSITNTDNITKNAIKDFYILIGKE